jgi:hypothetical protein
MHFAKKIALLEDGLLCRPSSSKELFVVKRKKGALHPSFFFAKKIEFAFL